MTNEPATAGDKPLPLSDTELAKEREWVEAPGLAAGVFDKSTVISIERRLLATIDADRERIAALERGNSEMRALLIHIEPRCEYVDCKQPGPHCTHRVSGVGAAQAAVSAEEGK